MQKCFVITVDPNSGVARPACSVKVLIAGTTTLANLFADNEVTPLVNPLTSDSAGRTFFKTTDGEYDFEVSGEGFTTYKYTNIQVADKDNFAPAAGAPPVGPDVIPTGVILNYAGSVAPTGWRVCDGAAISRAAFAALFAVIGTTYGVGDGSTTFNVPNFKGRVPTGLDASQTEFTPLGKLGGFKTHTLTTAELASHTHATSVPAHTHGATQDQHGHPMLGSNAAAGAGPTGTMAPGTAFTALDNSASSVVQPLVSVFEADVSVTVIANGSNAAHNNLQPYLTMNFIIRT